MDAFEGHKTQSIENPTVLVGFWPSHRMGWGWAGAGLGWAGLGLTGRSQAVGPEFPAPCGCGRGHGRGAAAKKKGVLCVRPFRSVWAQGQGTRTLAP